ncbi:MAG: Fic family protein, partial [Bdellovibrionales bacterium]|nr:Fic family protein [Bdellovibrionales bacterium]
RFNPAEVQLPSGKLQSFNMVSNPINRAREIAGHALDFIYNEKPIEGAAYAYAHLVLEHLFKSANRRTAVLAAVWVLSLGDFEVDADELLNVPLGDLREPGVKEQLKETIEKLIRKI